MDPQVLIAAAAVITAVAKLIEALRGHKRSPHDDQPEVATSRQGEDQAEAEKD